MKISVVTITYNAQDCLQRTLDSVLSQTFPDVEHIIVDGASSDNTLKMAEAYKRQSELKAASHEVIIQSEPDNGLYDAMNKGLNMASGDYIIYMNAGDTFASESTLLLIADCANKCQRDTGRLPAVVYGETDWTDDLGIIIGHRNHSVPKKLSWRSFKQGMLVCHQAFYARLDLAKRCPYNLKYRFSADIDWCIRVMKEADKQGLSLVNAQQLVALYQKEGQTTQNHRASLKERFDVMCNHYGTITTYLLHAWFVVRGIFRKIIK